MTGMQSLSIGVILFTLLPIYIHAVSLKFRTKPGPLTYVRLGDTLRLEVSYDFDGTDDVTVTWKFGGAVATVQKVGNNPVKTLDSRATLEGQASLVLKNTSLKDNITFTVRITSFGATDIESSFQVIVTAVVSLKFRTKPGALTYVRLGDTLRLEVSYDYEGTDDVTVTWKFGGAVATVQKVGNNPVKTLDPRATLEGQASLVLKNTTLNDSITFTVEITSFGVPDLESSFQVIVTVKPDALTEDCNEIKEVNQGGNVGCRCYSTKGNPTPTASWYKDGTLIGGVGISETRLALNNVTIKDNGTYTCQLQSYDLKNETSVHVFVKFATDSVEISSEKTNNIAALGTKVIIKCVANGYPAPTYTIVLNGTQKLTDVVGGVKTIEKATYEDAGLYTCVTANYLGNGLDSFTLRVQALFTTHPTTPSVQITTNEREKNISDISCNSGSEWYLFLITLICGVIVGMVLLYAIMWLRLRLSKKGDHSIPSQPGAVAGPSGKGLENASAYQELDLRNMNKDYDNYQSLRMTSRNAQSNTAPVEIDNEAGYQDLNEVRGNTDDNYQPLNRV